MSGNSTPPPEGLFAMPDNITQAKETFVQVITFIFSWIIVLPLCVIITGKCFRYAFDYNTSSGDEMKIKLLFFQVSARDSEVWIGLGTYLLLFFATLFFFPSLAETTINSTGINIDKWNAICVFSALLSSAIAMVSFFGLVLFPRLLPKRALISRDLQGQVINRIIEKQEQPNT